MDLPARRLVRSAPLVGERIPKRPVALPEPLMGERVAEKPAARALALSPRQAVQYPR